MLTERPITPVMDRYLEGRLLWILLGAMLLLAFALRAGYLLLHVHDFRLSGDALNYQIMSWQWVEDGIYGYALQRRSVTPNAYVTPGYPLLLSAAYGLVRDPYRQITLVRFAQLLLGTASVGLGFVTVRRLLKRVDVALLVAFLIAVYPPYVQSTLQILTEVAALFTMLLYFWLQTVGLEKASWRWNLAAGLALAAQLLVRPVLLPLAALPFVYVLVKWGWRARARVARAALWTAGGTVLLLFPWWLRNLLVLNSLVLTSTGSGNPFLAGTYPYLRNLLEDFQAGGYKGTDQGWFARKRLREGFSQQPWLYLRWYTIGKIRFTFEEPWLYQGFARRPNLMSVIKGAHQVLCLAGLAGLVLGAFRRRILALALVYLALFTGLYLVFIPTSRYAYQLMFFLILGAAFLACSLVDVVLRAVAVSPSDGRIRTQGDEEVDAEVA